MSKLRYVSSLLRPSSTFISNYSTNPNNLVGIRFLKKQSSVQQGIIYLCSEDFAESYFSETTLLPGCIFVVCESNGKKLSVKYANADCTIFCTQLSVVDVYETLNDYMTLFHYWSEICWRSIAAKTTEKEFVDMIARLSDGICILLNEQGDLIFKSTSAYNTKWLMLYKMCVYPFASPKELIRAGNYDDICTKYEDTLNHTTYYCVQCSIAQTKNTLIIIKDSIIEDKDYPSLTLLAGKSLERLENLRFNDENDIYEKNQILFSQALRLVKKETYMSKKDYTTAYSSLVFPIRSRLRCGVISLQPHFAELIPHSVINSELKGIFSSSNFCHYENNYILLFSYDEENGFRDTYDMDSFNRMLLSFNTIMCISEEFCGLEKVYAQYSYCCHCLELKETLHPEDRSPIIWQKDYTLDLQVYYAILYQQRHISHADYSYLYNPLLLGLYREDLKKETDYFLFLMKYLSHHENLSEVAKEMYIHRNTALKRLHKICDKLKINEQQLKDNFHSLYASCLVIKYLAAKNLIES